MCARRRAARRGGGPRPCARRPGDAAGLLGRDGGETAPRVDATPRAPHPTPPPPPPPPSPSLSPPCASISPTITACSRVRAGLRDRRGRPPRPRSSTAPRPSLRARGQDGPVGLDGHPVPRGGRRRRRHHAPVRARRRGAHARRLERRDHHVRAHLAGHPAGVPVRQRRAEGAPAARPLLGREARRLRPDRARGGLRRGQRRGRAPRSTAASGSVDGTKQFITNAGTDVSGHVAITARTGEQEISNLIVERGTPGYEQGTP